MGPRLCEQLGRYDVPLGRVLHAGLQRRQRQLDQDAESEFPQLYDGRDHGEGHHVHVADDPEEKDEFNEGVYQLPEQGCLPPGGRAVVFEL